MIRAVSLRCGTEKGFNKVIVGTLPCKSHREGIAPCVLQRNGRKAKKAVQTYSKCPLKMCYISPVVMAPTFSPSTQEAEPGGFLSSRPNWSIEWVSEQPGLLYRGNILLKHKTATRKHYSFLTHKRVWKCILKRDLFRIRAPHSFHSPENAFTVKYWT